MTDILLTLALVPSDFPVAGGAPQSLWLTVQPHIHTQDFRAWLDDAYDGSTYRYLMLTKENASARSIELERDDGKIVPVPLPANIGITVRLLDAQGAQLGPDLKNDRRGLVIPPDMAVQQRFTDDNARPPEGNDDGRRELPPAGPFALGFVDQLKALVARCADQSDLSIALNMLKLSFWGGGLRRLRPSTVLDQNLVHLHQIVPRLDPPLPTPAEIKTVPQLALIGHMIMLNKSVALPDLAQVRTLQLYIHRNGAAPVPSNLVDLGPDERDFLLEYFSKWVSGDIPQPRSIVTPSEVPDVDKRVYAVQQLTALAGTDVYLGDMNDPATTIFRKSPEGAKAPPPVRLDEIERFVIRHASGGSGSFPSSLQAIQVTPLEVIEVQIRPYRLSAGQRQLLMVTPLLRDRARFIELFPASAPPSVRTTWPAGAKIVGQDGKRVSIWTGSENIWLEDTFVGWYAFPWDDPANANPADFGTTSGSIPTVLFYFEMSGLIGQNRLTIITQANTGGADIKAELRGLDGDNPETGGPRWEWRRGSTVLPAVSVGAFALGAPADILPALKPAIALNDDTSFYFSRSATAAEGILQVRYACGADDDPVQSPRDDFIREVSNYNALNVYSRYTDSTGAVVGDTVFQNFWSELFPVFQDRPQTGEHLNVFQYRYRFPIYMPSPVVLAGGAADPAGTARKFFQESYQQITLSREIILDLQHTIGDHFELIGPTRGYPTFHDQPPALPTDSAHRSPALSTKDEPFFTVEFLPGEIASLKLRMDYLQELIDPKTKAPVPLEKDQVLLAAWRSVAEIATAQSVFLTGRFRRFDYALAAAKATAKSVPLSLADGLVPVLPYEDYVWKLPQKFIDDCRTWLKTGAPKSYPPLKIDLTVPGAVETIAESCLLAEFQLGIERDPALQPPSGTVNFVRPKEIAVDGSLYDAGGQLIEPVMPPPASRYLKFRETIARRRSPIPPIESQRSEAQKFRDIFMPDEDAGTAGAWLLPVGVRIPVGQSPEAALLVLAFKPLAATFEDLVTYQALKRFSAALQLLLDCDPERQNAPASISAWQAWLEKTHQQRSAIGSFLSAVRTLIIPANDAKSPGIDARVAELIEKLAPTSADSLLKATAGALARSILGSPGLFGSARGFLLTQLGSPTADPLITDLYRMSMARDTGWAPTGIPEKPNENTTDKVTLDIGAALIEAVSPSSIQFLETLGDQKYDDMFGVTGLQAYDVEAIATAAAEGKPPTPLEISAVRTADCSCPSGSVAEVYLPSRQPLIPPTHGFSAHIPQCDAPDWLEPYDKPGAMLSKQELLARKIAPTTSVADGLTLVARTAPLPITPLKDVVKMTAVFYVVSDEDDQFGNDEFVVAFTSINNSSFNFRSASMDPHTVSLFHALASDSALSKITDIETTLTYDALNLAARALLSGTTASLPIGDAVITVEDKKLVFAPPTSTSEAYLFAPTFIDPNAAKGPRTYVLIVNSQFPVWQSHAIGLGQTRNRRGHGRNKVQFDPRLWLAAPVVGNGYALPIPMPEHAIITHVGPSIPRTVSIQQLVERTLSGPNLILPATAPGVNWRSKDLTVTVSALQTTSMPGLYPDDQGRSQISTVAVDQGAFARMSARWDGAGDVGEDVKFDSDYDDFVVDFIWTDSLNQELLRLSVIIHGSGFAPSVTVAPQPKKQKKPARRSSRKI